MGISRACASKWVNRYRQHGDLGLFDRSSTPSRQPTATSADVVAQIGDLRRRNKWSASRIAFELQEDGRVDGEPHQRAGVADDRVADEHGVDGVTGYCDLLYMTPPWRCRAQAPRIAPLLPPPLTGARKWSVASTADRITRSSPGSSGGTGSAGTSTTRAA